MGQHFRPGMPFLRVKRVDRIKKGAELAASWGTNRCQSEPVLDGVNSREGLAPRLSKGT